MSSARRPVIFMMTKEWSSMAVTRRSCAAMAAIKKVASVETIGDVTSSFAMCSHCGAPFAHALALTVPSRFSVRKMREARACLH